MRTLPPDVLLQTLMRNGYFRVGGVGGFSFDSKSFEKTQKVWIMLFKGAGGSAGC